jgi:hydroxymethylpyrimidine pyrophosphatase-like HAD family hydrolase
MQIAETSVETLREFVEASRFAERGAIVTDLDGTAVHELDGKIYIPEPVEFGLKKLHDLGFPFVLNSLRFPLSVMRTFGRSWTTISNAPIPTVALNGSLIGQVLVTEGDELVFREIDAFPLTAAEIGEALVGIDGLLAGGVSEILVFYYPRDWTVGEIIWTPDPGRIDRLRQKYRSASLVWSAPLDELRSRLLAEEICMIFLLIDAPRDRLMAYQHSKRSNFITHVGVDKLHGAQQMATRLGIDLERCVGAGDTELDVFLNGVGLAVLVGNANLDLRGRRTTLRVADSFALGDLLFKLADVAGEYACNGQRT